MEDDGARSTSRTEVGEVDQPARRAGHDLDRGRGERERTAVRLSVNLGEQPAAALHELMRRKGITATEAVRRALSIWKFVEDELARGNRVAVLEGEGERRTVRELIFHD